MKLRLMACLLIAVLVMPVLSNAVVPRVRPTVWRVLPAGAHVSLSSSLAASLRYMMLSQMVKTTPSITLESGKRTYLSSNEGVTCTLENSMLYC